MNRRHRFLLALLALAFAAPVCAQQLPPIGRVLAGEFALQAGQLPEAARQYLQAARAASDPVLAERATRIALLANEDALARESYGLWQSLAPQQTAPRQAVAATLALRSVTLSVYMLMCVALLAGGAGGRTP